jgi:hypothetical protein
VQQGTCATKSQTLAGLTSTLLLPPLFMLKVLCYGFEMSFSESFLAQGIMRKADR